MSKYERYLPVAYIVNVVEHAMDKFAFDKFTINDDGQILLKRWLNLSTGQKVEISYLPQDDSVRLALLTPDFEHANKPFPYNYRVSIMPDYFTFDTFLASDYAKNLDLLIDRALECVAWTS